MKINVLTLFPEMIENIAKESILGKAIEAGHITINAVNIRDYANNKHNRVDDYTYGGGAGMLMQAEPVYNCFMDVAGEDGRCIYVTPQGIPFSQKMAMEFAQEDEITILCGHYEGIDERVLEEIVTDYVSIGDYVLTGGELAAMVITDAVARLVPEVLGNEDSAEIESFHRNLLEYPQYTRPEVWHDKKVPDELLSGNPKVINPWREEKAVARTKERRPDLYKKYLLEQEVIEWLLSYKREFMYALEPLRRGQAEVIYWDNKTAIIRDILGEFIYIASKESEDLSGITEYIDKSSDVIMTSLQVDRFAKSVNKSSYEAYTCYTYTENIKKSATSEMTKEEAALRASINCAVERGETFYSLVLESDKQMCELMEKMGLYPSKNKVYCIR